MASLVFLTVNGVDPLHRAEDLEKMTFGVASGELSKAELVEWCEKPVVPSPTN